ncbi:unnamed protein product, partial [Thlaspi arvense]
VEVVALSSYEEKEEQCKEQVASLRQRFFHSVAPGGLAGDRRGVVPEQMWQKSSMYWLVFCCLPDCQSHVGAKLDISAEFRNGALPGLISLSTKLLPTVMNLMRKLAEQGQAPSANSNPQQDQSKVTTNRVSSSVGSSSSSLSSTETVSNSTKDD